MQLSLHLWDWRQDCLAIDLIRKLACEPGLSV